MVLLIRAVSAAILCLALPAAAQQRPSPDITVALNTGTASAAYAGWPLLVHATFAIEEEAASWVLQPDTVSIGIYDATGARVEMGFTPHDLPSAAVTLDAGRDFLILRWTLSPDQTAKLSGTYEVQLIVGDRRAKATFVVTTEPSPISPELASARRLLLADYNLLVGNYEAALESAKEDLNAEPASLAAMSRAASALERLGRNAEALQMLNQAIEEFARKFPTATHPPLELMRRQRNLILAAAGVAVR